MFISPLVQSPRLIAAQQNTSHGDNVSAVGSGPLEYIQVAEKYLSHKPWAANAGFQFKSYDSPGIIIYTQDWKPVDSDRAVRFEPFAMVWYGKDEDENQQPYTVVCDYAILKFESEFNDANSNPGRIIGGGLRGDVEIQGPEGLTVHGRNFVFSEGAARIWSGNPIDFTYGPHRGDALGVQIELIPTEGLHSGDKPQLSGVRSILLIRDVTMDLVFDADSNSEKAEPNVRIHSTGSFKFDLTTNVAAFEDDVQVLRQTGPAEFDSLDCDILSVYFEKLIAEHQPSKSEVAAPQDQSTEPDQPGLFEDLAFQRLLAEGDSVVLVSEKNQMTARMTELRYDAGSKVIVLADGNSVVVNQKNSRLRSPEITLQHDEDGKVHSAWCRGAGRLTQEDSETGEVVLDAQWLHQLRKYPDTETGWQIIELQEQAVVRQPKEKIGLTADTVKLWVDESQSGSKQKIKSEFVDSNKFRPKRLQAFKNVGMASPQLRAQTEFLDIQFKEKTKLAGQPKKQTADSKKLLPRSPEEKANNSEKKQGPLNVSADTIRVTLVTGEHQKEPHVSNIYTLGNVKVSQTLDADKAPLKISGDQLHVENNGGNDQILHIFGKPAHIRDPDLHISGNNIHLDRAKNLVWVNEAGLLQRSVNKSLEGKPLDKPRMLNIRWQEQMEFNGLQASFYGGVEASLDDSRLQCEEMQVILTDRLSFTDRPKNKNKKRIEISQFHCNDGVSFDSSTYEEGQLVEVRRANFWKFSLDRLTGKTEAQGPGQLSVWKKGRARRAGIAPTATVQANRPLKPNDAEWEYLRIDFQGKNIGNIDKRYSTFYDRVQLVYGPVQQPLEKIDPDELTDDAATMRAEKLQITQAENEKDDTSFVQMLATGNAQLEGKLFHARADLISFDESNEMYRLRSLGNRKAIIWHQKTVSDEFNKGVAQSISFAPSRNHLRLDQTTGLKGLN